MEKKNQNQKVIKLSFNDKNTEFIVNKKSKSVVCNLIAHICFNGDFDASITGFGVAHLQNGDSFDVEKGKKVALAKAEANAYKHAVCHFNEKIREWNKALEWINEFKVRATEVVEHNKEYIRTKF